MDGTIDFSMLPEIRARLRDIEKDFLSFAGVGPGGQPVFGVDLLAIRQKLSSEAFRSYIEASRELRYADGLTSSNRRRA